MTYGQVKNQVLQLLNQYSVAGTMVASSYNNQQDYLNRIPALVNDATLEIATTARKIPAVLTLRVPEPPDPEAGETEDEDVPAVACEEFGDRYRFELPEDFYQFKTGDTFVTTEDGHVMHTNRYQIEGRKYLLIPKKDFEKGRVYTITYYRYPKLLADTPEAEDELDNVPETHYAIPYYVAAFLVIHDDNFQFSAFYNKYEDKLQKMGPGASAEAHAVGDVYGFARGEDYWT